MGFLNRTASQRELDALTARVESLDDRGPRGVGVIQTQLTEVSKDLAKLEARLDAHQAQHEQERHERIVGRRWLIATGIALASSVTAIAGVLATIAHQLR
jgi:hypothetical protein